MDFIFNTLFVKTDQKIKNDTKQNDGHHTKSNKEKQIDKDLEHYKKRDVIRVYLFGIFLTLMHNLIIYKTVPNLTIILIVLFILNTMILLSNMYFSYHDTLDDYTKEISLYQYVEDNGRVLLSASLAISLFLNVLLNTSKKKVNIFNLSIPIVISFIYAASVLTIVWMPNSNGYYIRILRDLKTTFLTNSIFSLLTAMSNIIKIIY
jgi:cation transport ATPase